MSAARSHRLLAASTRRATDDRRGLRRADRCRPRRHVRVCAAKRASRTLRASDRGARPRATTRSTRRRSADAEYDALFRELVDARGGASRAGHARLADAARGRRAGRGVRRRSRTACRCCRSTTRSTDAEAEAFDRRVRDALGVDARPLCLRAEVRRPRDQPALRGRALRRRRDARRRRDGRERHREPAHGRARSRCAAGASAPHARRSPRRGADAPARLRAAERATGSERARSCT